MKAATNNGNGSSVDGVMRLSKSATSYFERFWSAAIPRVRDRFQKRGHVRALQIYNTASHLLWSFNMISRRRRMGGIPWLSSSLWNFCNEKVSPSCAL